MNVLLEGSGAWIHVSTNRFSNGTELLTVFVVTSNVYQFSSTMILKGFGYIKMDH